MAGPAMRKGAPPKRVKPPPNKWQKKQAVETKARKSVPMKKMRGPF